ncbi:MAG: hypothetical protein M1609_11495, partial [Firmicutes bacterium]|nr:hypothetical protein [Bacillota bacterium]
YTTGLEVKEAYYNKPAKCIDCHLQTNKEAFHTVTASNCSACHADNLIQEHDRVSSSGQQLDCNTCHNSNSILVQQAITEKNKDCLACHTQVDHESVHTSGLDINCQTCHNPALTQEHMTNSTTAGKNYNCGTCHDSTGKEVIRTIKANSLSCAGCHQQGHNIIFTETVPADIPLYTGFIWTSPMEVSLFVYESSTPWGYENGQVVLSNRQANITVGDIWTFYTGQMAANGWTIKSGGSGSGEYFTAEFEKEGRLATLKCYHTAVNNGIGDPVDAGFRIEIWYL